MSSASYSLPRWVEIGLLPVWNLLVALAVSAAVVLAIGHSPVQAFQVLVKGALGTPSGLGYTLYYATTFVFTGLAVAVALPPRC